MNIKQFIEESCNESLIEKIYYNELYFQEYIPDSKEYEKANKKMLKASDFIMNNIDEKIKTKFIEYMENATIKKE